MKIKYLLLLIPLFAIIIISCNTTEPPIIIPPPPPPDFRKITLTFEDASCTEVWLKIKTDSLTFPAEIKLLKDSVAQHIILTSKDTILYVDSLLPNEVYNFQAVLSKNTTIKSEQVTVQTLETTSHNFTWQSWTFGQHSSSVLYDVAIIDENNIWAVGEIYMNDSLGNPDPIAYNAVHWDGNEWELKKINILFRGSTITPPLESVFTFAANDIWFVGSLPIHGDGINWVVYDLRTTVDPNLSVSKAWGVSSNDIYFVGRNGSIAHKAGNMFSKIESGTILTIYDIWGDLNPTTNEYEILALASDHTTGNGTSLLKINNSIVESISTEGLPLSMDAIWFKSERIYYAVGDGFYTTRILGDQWIRDLSIPRYYITTIRGTNYNNIFLGGTVGLLMHYNGTDWKNYQFIQVNYNDFFASIAVKGNLVCAVGANANNKAIIYLGTKR